MNQESHTALRLPPGQARRLDPVCDRFETAWLAGDAPRLEDFLPLVQETDRPALWNELLALELDYRGRRGDRPVPEEYLQRFPEFADTLAGHFQAPDNHPKSEAVAESADMPPRIGRFRILKILGEGGSGRVYLAHDDQLHRQVAIKVPRRRPLSQPGEADTYLNEARALASLDHPHIVPVHDVGTTADGQCYVVSKLIEGCDLAAKTRQTRLSSAQAAELVATIAQALHYAHLKGLVHRDIKPGNILLDALGQAYIADFGLALREEDLGRGARFAGTPAYMSPEQARGEGHRVDGRSDIFSLGVVLYELLTGRRPFPGETQGELLEQIIGMETRPPRQIDDAIPKELERICLKALAKRASERYLTALDMADDLRHFLAKVEEEVGPVCRAGPAHGAARQAAPTRPLTPSSESQPLKIVPKDLRSFDAEDADFFLSLLPGPRDRDGLPDSIRFWKTRIEASDPSTAVSVGLIYGPSGCGKSSLVKAGLLPLLSSHVQVIYLEATARETEGRLLRGLRHRFSGLPADLDLTETLSLLRRGHGLPVGQKILIVLDQFEQWLHGRNVEEDGPLVEALRQCDGGRVQCLLLVRDDFWMGLTRFLRRLEIDLVQGRNCAAVDLFDQDHGKRVLAACGRAFGKLPDSPGEISKEQREFLHQAVSGLAQEGKIICVRLSLFAHMIKSKPWTLSTLKDVGGAKGVGVTFLEETFSSATANPRYWLHEKAARAVLQALLPPSRSDIKGTMRSHAELLEASGYGNRARDFEDLIGILDGEIRLITPVDPEGKEEGGRMKDEERSDSSFILHPSSFRCYQLTHDYLVHSLRDWLTRRQKQTRRGRAALLLADRAAVWDDRRENRQLPSLLQWLQIRRLTQRRKWTPPERHMMRRANRYHLLRGMMILGCLMLLALASWDGWGRLQAHRLRDRVLEATTANVPDVVKDMAGYSRWLDPLLREAYDQARRTGDRRKQLHASLALLPTDPGQVEYLYECLLMAEPQEVVVIRQGLLDHRQDLLDRLWTRLENRQEDQSQRLHAACALAGFAPDDPRWQNVRDDVTGALVIQKRFEIAQWTEALKGARQWLMAPLADCLVDEQRSVSERGMIASLYGIYATDLPDAWAGLEKQLIETNDPSASTEAKIVLARRQASIAMALLVNRRVEKVWPLFQHSSDPTVRSYVIDRVAAAGVDSKFLLSRLEQGPETSERRALMLALGDYGLDRLSRAQRSNLLPPVRKWYQDDPDRGIHAAAGWLLRQWQAVDQVKAIDRQLATGKPEGARQWYINREGHTMILVPRPGEISLQHLQVEGEFNKDGMRHTKHRIDRCYAIASLEVTAEQFLRFCPDRPIITTAGPTPDCPMGRVSWYDAAAYCNWLSAQEDIPPEQWCYEPLDMKQFEPGFKFAEHLHLMPFSTFLNKPIYGRGMRMASNYLHRTGYRLPTAAEWRYACRAGAETLRSFGAQEELVDRYEWCAGNSGGKLHPVGSLKPNDFGLFDMQGSVTEWAQDAEWAQDWFLRFATKVRDDVEHEKDMIKITNADLREALGGSFLSRGAYLRTDTRGPREPTYNTQDWLGFRVARTVR